jgi:hypothetical protein
MRLIGAVAAVSLFGTITQASADTITFTYTGTVGGYDYAGDFGTPGTNLNGDPFSLVFTLDTTKGTVVTRVGSTFIMGGTGEASYLGSTPVTAVLIIAGHPFSIFTGLGNEFGLAEISNAAFQSTIQEVQTYDSHGDNTYLTMQDVSFTGGIPLCFTCS